jgi:hypothetical protein
MNVAKSTWIARMTTQLGGARERAASALEWALIVAIIVVAATFIGAAVYNIVQDRAAGMENCSNTPDGGQCTP